MITAGHNVFTWRANGGRAREIIAYAGYDGASSINDPSVEVRKAKRVVTTSQWLSNRGSMAHDFAMVMFDKPFTNVEPFQYIETPAKDKLELGVVGYPADKIDATTGERGGKMYELFENTEYNIMEQKDTMLQHYIDSEGGNSGGPVLRRSDLCAIATHVYGGDCNTASVLGRYGNPIQDYIAAFDLPLANPGQINLVPVNNTHICQSDAATGHQCREIAKLGDNVAAPTSGLNGHNGKPNGTNGTKEVGGIKGTNGTKPTKPEFWIFEGADEIFRLTRDIATALGPAIAAPVGSAILPTIVQGIKLAQQSSCASSADLDAALRRALLANSTFMVAQQKHASEEGWFDDVVSTVTAPLGIDVPRVEPIIKLPFDEVMRVVGVAGDAAEKLVYDVAGEVTRGLLLRTQIPELARLVARAESAMDVDSAPAASENDVAFMRHLAQATSKAGPKEEGWFDDVGDFFKGAADTVAEVATDSAKLVVKTGLATTGVMLDAAQGASEIVGKVGDAFGTKISEDRQLKMLKALHKDITERFGESAFDSEPESLFDELTNEIKKIAQALILHQVLADQFLSSQMARPVTELKEEGFFDDVGDFFSNGKNLQVIGAGISTVGTVAPFVPVVGPVLGLGLLGVGGVTTAVGLAI
ncbi:hypothetical protein F5Y04DRAFT_254025 [Hypomontagnella monticulosa]|nr:hypothetical protein F5Y04DRAFT_254025 [Hypomontagnella monticulosa]